MKFMLMLPGVLIALIACGAAFALTSAIDLPTAADIGIWVVAAGYSLFGLFAGLATLVTFEEF